MIKISYLIPDSYENDWSVYGVQGVGGSNPLAPTNKFGQVEKVSKTACPLSNCECLSIEEYPCSFAGMGFRFCVNRLAAGNAFVSAGSNSL